MLRRSQLPWGLGYLSNPLPGGFERALRVGKRDLRVHFALNCGAASCPPIAAYTPADIGRQLDLASDSYLYGEVEYDPEGGVVRVPRLCLWYYGDFRGRNGIRSLLRRYDVIPDGASPQVRHKGYDWSLDRGKLPRVAFDPRRLNPVNRSSFQALTMVARRPSQGRSPERDDTPGENLDNRETHHRGHRWERRPAAGELRDAPE